MYSLGTTADKLVIEQDEEEEEDKVEEEVSTTLVVSASLESIEIKVFKVHTFRGKDAGLVVSHTPSLPPTHSVVLSRGIVAVKLFSSCILMQSLQQH